MDSVCVITYRKDGTVHTVVPTRTIAKQYCKEHTDYEWECYSIQNAGEVLC